MFLIELFDANSNEMFNFNVILFLLNLLINVERKLCKLFVQIIKSIQRESKNDNFNILRERFFNDIINVLRFKIHFYQLKSLLIIILC